MTESSSSRTSSLFLIISLNDFFGSSLREPDIFFHSSVPNLEKAFLFCISIFEGFISTIIGSRRACVVGTGLFCKRGHHLLDWERGYVTLFSTISNITW